jgi:putative transposase
LLSALAVNYPVKRITEALGVSRSHLYYLLNKSSDEIAKLEKVKHRYAHLKFYFDSLSREFPKYGYRRIRIMLRRRYGIYQSKKTTQLIMRAFNLSLGVKKKKAKPNYQKIEAIAPNELWQTDMTKIWVENTGWLHLFCIIDCFSREIVGYSLSLFAGTKELLEALEMAVMFRFSNGIPEDNKLTVASDNGCQFTAKAFIAALKDFNFKFMRTNYNCPEQNCYIESFFSSLKEEEVWLNEYASVAEAEESISRWLYKYNNERIHSSLDYLTPAEFMAHYEKIQAVPITLG